MLVAVLAITGIASAELLNNPETFDAPDFADGLLNGQNGWEAWGSGSGSGGWGGGASHAVVNGGAIDISPIAGWWSNNLIFNHGNEIAALPVAPGYGTGSVQLSFDVINGVTDTPNGDGFIKFEFYDDLARTTQIAVVSVGGQQWEDGTHYLYQTEVPAGAVYWTPVIATWSDWATIDNVKLVQVPEPMTMGLLGLGGLFLRRRKK
ncbi:MAG: PEP-CTERM sorting domain-containing protein [Planctomycetota bacterium]